MREGWTSPIVSASSSKTSEAGQDWCFSASLSTEGHHHLAPDLTYVTQLQPTGLGESYFSLPPHYPLPGHLSVEALREGKKQLQVQQLFNKGQLGGAW